jgi:hypothetical protein
MMLRYKHGFMLQIYKGYDGKIASDNIWIDIQKIFLQQITNIFSIIMKIAKN